MSLQLAKDIGMGGGSKDVLVTDKNWQFLESTRPGKARILVKEGKATFISEKPPMIQLNRTVDLERGGKKMQTINEYFKGNNDEVYIQNVSGGIVSLTFKDVNGDVVPFSLPNDRRPLCLTNRIPMELIKRSTDIRALVQRTPPAIRLLTQEEYTAMLETIARESGQTVEQVINNINEKVSLAQSKIVQTSPEDARALAEDTVKKDEEGGVRVQTGDIDIPGMVEDNVDPRVMQIVASCAEDAGNRMEAKSAIEQLSLMNLTAMDLEYIKGNCAWKSVIAWAAKKKVEDKKKEDK